MIESFPLYWPVGYKRTESRKRSLFKVTMDNAQQFLRNEIKRMGAKDLIVSTNIPTRKDGGLYSDWMSKRIEDPGVAIYFKYKDQNISMCCDQYHKVWENVYALGKGIEALRGMERWGVSDFLERAFTGFTALAEKNEREWWQVLGVEAKATEQEIKDAYRKRAKQSHPDAGGNIDMFNEVNRAYNKGLEVNNYIN
jgi:hypothetical protein